VICSSKRKNPSNAYSKYEVIVEDFNSRPSTCTDENQLFEIKTQNFENDEVFVIKPICNGLKLLKNYESIELVKEMQIVIFDEDIVEIRKPKRSLIFKDLRKQDNGFEIIGNRYITKNVSIGNGLTASVIKAQEIQSPFGMFALKMFPLLNDETFYESEDDMIDVKLNLEASKKEVDVLTRLSHPNIVSLIDSFDISSHFVIVLEMMDMNLLEFINQQRNRHLTPGLTKDAAYQVLQGLNHLHTHGIAHNDIKCENILVKNQENGRFIFKICDLGSSSADIFNSKSIEFSENYQSPGKYF
jgi:hypothetical protein